MLYCVNACCTTMATAVGTYCHCCHGADEGSRESVDSGCRKLTASWVRDRAQQDGDIETCEFYEGLERVGCSRDDAPKPVGDAPKPVGDALQRIVHIAHVWLSFIAPPSTHATMLHGSTAPACVHVWVPTRSRPRRQALMDAWTQVSTRCTTYECWAARKSGAPTFWRAT